MKKMNFKTVKIFLIVMAAICYSGSIMAQNSGVVGNASGKTIVETPVNKVKDEKSFVKYSDQALAIMVKKAEALSVKGAAIIGFIPGEKTESWITKMSVVGSLTNAKSNLLGIAYSKASDMAATLQNSGTVKERTVLQGEFGYQGGLIKKIKTGYIIAVFSGGKTEQDLQIAQEGLNAL
jgi:flagellar hook protein FlgE